MKTIKDIGKKKRNGKLNLRKKAHRLPCILKFAPYVSPQIDCAKYVHARPSFVPWLHKESLNLLMTNKIIKTR